MAASHLNDELLVEILSHLPARSLYRFKCVSRAWRDLIAHPEHQKKLPTHTLATMFRSKVHPSPTPKPNTTRRPGNPASFLSMDLIVEILSRLSPRSLHRFKCVSRAWRDLIAHPEHQKKLPTHTLATMFRSKVHPSPTPKPNTTRRPGNPASFLSMDLIVEILYRLSPWSLHRFKCVSRAWRDLIAHPEHQKKLPQTLAGFWYHTFVWRRQSQMSTHFAEVSDAPHPSVEPSLSYLPPKYKNISVSDSCGGLLLCNYMVDPYMEDSGYIICNPATRRWVELPPHSRPKAKPGSVEKQPTYVERLAFDPDASPHFHVLLFEEWLRWAGGIMRTVLTGVNVYSSQTSTWKQRDIGLDKDISLCSGKLCVFVNGMLHMLTSSQSELVAVDTEGKVCQTFDVPDGLTSGLISLSQGCLVYVSTSPEITVWCLDFDAQTWILQYHVSADLLRRAGQVYTVTAVHSDQDIIFLVSLGSTVLESYNMRHREIGSVIFLEEGSTGPYLPYVPLFSESLADANGDLE